MAKSYIDIFVEEYKKEKRQAEMEKTAEECAKIRKYLAERYGEKSGVLKGYLDGIESVIQPDNDSDIVYKLILNENRTKRFGGIPGFSESIHGFQRGEPNNIIFYNEYYPYHVAVNPVPISYGALTLIKEKSAEVIPTTVNNEVCRGSLNDLETLLRLSNETGTRVFHNMDGAGASKLEAHWQATTDSFQIEFIKREEINAYYGIYTLIDYPGDNVIFTGKQKIEKSLEFVEHLNSRRIPHNIILANNEIYVIPIKNEFAGKEFGLDIRSRIAGCEVGNCCYIALNRDDFNRIKNKEKIKIKKFKDGAEVEEERELSVKEIIKEALFEKEKIIKESNTILRGE